MKEQKEEPKYLVMIHPCPAHAHVNRYNGYVAFDKRSPWYWYNDIEDYGVIECNGGITFVERMKRSDLENYEIIDDDKLQDKVMVIGFDTLWSWDTDEMWPKEKVIAEAKNIRQQLIDLKPEDYE